MDKTLIEQAREFIQANRAWVADMDYSLFAADQVADFAAKIRDEAVAGMVNEIRETVFALNSHEQHTGLIEPCPICDACERIWKLYE